MGKIETIESISEGPMKFVRNNERFKKETKEDVLGFMENEKNEHIKKLTKVTYVLSHRFES